MTPTVISIGAFAILFSGSLIAYLYWYRREQYKKLKVTFLNNKVQIQRYTALNELAKTLASTYKTQDVVFLLIETISRAFMVPGGVYTFLLFDSSCGKALHAVRYSKDREKDAGLNRERLDISEVYNAWVAAQHNPLFVSDAMTDSRFPGAATEGGVRSLVAVPMMTGSEILGLIRIESCFPNLFRQDDTGLLSNFADLGAKALEHVALYRQTIELAITDELTGLYVQRYFKERVKDEISRAHEHKLPLSLLMLDMDNFKYFNDRYGKLEGDRVLKIVAQILRETVRTVDLVACYGGEIFSVLLLKTPLQMGKVVAEKIRQDISAKEIYTNGQTTHVTISIGVSELSPVIKEAEEFIDSADKALYQAKAAGKNCVRCANMDSSIV